MEDWFSGIRAAPCSERKEKLFTRIPGVFAYLWHKHHKVSKRYSISKGVGRSGYKEARTLTYCLLKNWLELCRSLKQNVVNLTLLRSTFRTAGNGLLWRRGGGFRPPPLRKGGCSGPGIPTQVVNEDRALEYFCRCSVMWRLSIAFIQRLVVYRGNSPTLTPKPPA